MRKSVKLMALLLTAVTVCVAMAGCGGVSVGGGEEKSKTNLYVATYDGGFGADWIDDVAAAFEARYANYKNGDKVGVKVHVTKSTKTGQTVYNSMAAETNDIYFLFFQDNYYNFVNSDYLLDITDIVTENIPEQGHSILSVMDEQLAAYYGVEKDGETKYYSVPYSVCYYSFAYDAELFYKEGLFLTREYDEKGNEGPVADYLIQQVIDSNRVYANLVTEGDETYYKTLKGDYLSKGPDGEYGTSDDGMPKTMTEFYALCDYMSTETGVSPFLFFGSKGESYLRQALGQVAATANGYTNTKTQYTMNGTLDNLISVGDDGMVTKLDSVTLTPDNSGKNAIEQFKQSGYYTAAQLGEKIFANNYCHADALSETNSLTDAQITFIESIDKSSKAAFYVDGIWWEHEIETYYEKNGRTLDTSDRQFKLLNIPKASASDVGSESVNVSEGRMGAFILSKIDSDKIEIAKKFLQMAMTDEYNAKYTVTTGAPRPYSYDLTDAQYNSLSSYQKDVWNCWKNGSVVFTYSGSEWMQKHSGINEAYYAMFAKINGSDYSNLKDMYKVNNFTAKQVFDGLYKYNLANHNG